jgi:hypothetical protein
MPWYERSVLRVGRPHARLIGLLSRLQVSSLSSGMLL